MAESKRAYSVNRSHFALAFLVLLVAFFAFRWLFSEPTITGKFVEAPLVEVLRTMERQGRVTLRSNLAPETPVTLELHRAPVVEAIDLLAVRLDAGWRWAWVVGPDHASVARGMDLGAGGGRETITENGWRSFFYPTPWQSMVSDPPDPRRFSWAVELPADPSFTTYLDQASQKLPVQILAPSDWAPSTGKVPQKGSFREVLRALLKPSRGQSAEVFYVTRNSRSGGGGQPADSRENATARPDAGGGGGERGNSSPASGGGGWMQTAGASANQQWLDERNEKIIAALPPEEQASARETDALFREFREATRDLSQEERRAVAGEFFNRPEVQQRMEETMANRDAKRTPEQREARYRRMTERRIEAREEAGRPLVARP